MLRSAALSCFGVFLCASALALGGCADGHDDDASAPAEEHLTSSGPEATVRAYYAATQTGEASAKLEPIVADGAVLAAPSVKLLTGKPQIEGKASFIKAVAGNASILGKATLRDLIVRGDDLVVSRIDLPLPNGDTITQVEFFALEGGKIKRLDSYYDSLRFSAAIPAILLERLKSAFAS